ncbi:MAG: histidine triad nucleotide-binding protein [Armatimonadaceae bacterium]
MSDNIFAKIGRGEVAVNAVYEDEFVVAFPDIAPQAPVHVLVIPRAAIVDTLGLTSEDPQLAGRLLLACAEVARRTGIDQSGFRVVLNTGVDGGQTVPHLHAHVLGGRPLGWPPG